MRLGPRFALLALVVCGLTACGSRRETTIVVGSKNFTEQVVLSEILAQHLETATGAHVERRFYLGGTYIAHQALLAGRIDVYVEYTGTALTAVLKKPVVSDPGVAYETVRSAYQSAFNLEVGPPLGFENTFAIVVRGEDARRLKLGTLSDAAPEARSWRAAFGYEFMERPDGFPGLAAAYNLEFAAPPRIMDLGLLYRSLKEGQVDLVAGNSTDGPIGALDLFVLQDDKRYFPPYEAVPIARAETLAQFPKFRPALEQLRGRIDASRMRAMNHAVDGNQRDVADVAREFLGELRPN
ncbi:MAG TPA: glycine betaine ABC transporter substrate-binding protein [Vicinamibacterales bacterium]|jgi:osmoprotectant transport system substrate-binding protein